MPTVRPEVSAIRPYVPGRPIDEVAREYGFDPATVVKLASNESPLPPFPEAEVAMRTRVGDANRYPDNDCHDLREALAGHLGVPADHLWIGAGSSELLRVAATAVGGPGTSAVYAWPSFVIYRLGSVLAGSESVEVPLGPGLRIDLDALLAAIRDDTTAVYVCNPNNPTGTVLPAGEVSRFVAAVPDHVLVVLDEAYHEYVTDPRHETGIRHAIDRGNVIVTRTFSKIYGMAALRVGYAVGRPETLVELRKAQAPFTVTALGQLAAVESLRHADETARRARENAEQRAHLESHLASLGLEYAPSQANFVYFRMAGFSDPASEFLRHAVIIRPFGGEWVRVTVGSSEENERFLGALRAVLRAGGHPVPDHPAAEVVPPDA